MTTQNLLLCHVQALSSTGISKVFKKKLNTASDHGLHLQQNAKYNNVYYYDYLWWPGVCIYSIQYMSIVRSEHVMYNNVHMQQTSATHEIVYVNAWGTICGILHKHFGHELWVTSTGGCLTDQFHLASTEGRCQSMSDCPPLLTLHGWHCWKLLPIDIKHQSTTLCLMSQERRQPH